MQIQQARKRAKLTQETLSKILGVSRSAIAMWETGQTSPRSSMLPKIAAVLGCTVDELLRKEG